jgi:hypothetical protein
MTSMTSYAVMGALLRSNTPRLKISVRLIICPKHGTTIELLDNAA